MIRVLVVLLLTTTVAMAQPPKKLTPGEQKALYAEWRQLYEGGAKLHDAGKLDAAAESFEKALRIARRLFPKSEYPNGRPELADTFRGLAGVYEQLGRFAEAETAARESLAEFRRVHTDRDHPMVTHSQARLAYLLQTLGKYAEAETLFGDALATYRRLHADRDHLDVARELLNVAFVLRAQGRLADAEPLYRQSLDMHRRLFPDQDHRGVAISLSHMGGILRARGRPADAEPFFRDALAMHRRLHADRDHPEVAQEMNNLAVLLYNRGKFAEAEPLYRGALAMFGRLLRGRDHPIAANCMNNLGRLLESDGRPKEAEGLFREALAVFRRLYPKADHPDVALTLTNLAVTRARFGALDEAEELQRDALAIRRRVYGKGDHPDVVSSLLAVGNLLRSRGKYDDAEGYLTDALAAHRRLYPAGDHTDVAFTLSCLASLRTARRKLADADPLLREAAGIYRALAEESARSRPEGDTLVLLAETPELRDAYLSNARALNSDPAAVYREVWASKGAVARVYERRQLAARAATDPAAAKLVADLSDARRRRAELLLAPVPADPATRKKRDDGLAALDRLIAERDRDLRPRLPTVGRAEKLTSATPDDLRTALAADAVVVDYLRYRLYEYDPAKPGADGTKRTFCYLAFVVTRERVSWVDLGPAQPIENAIDGWRAAITSGKPVPPELPAKVRELVWAKVRSDLPAAAKVVYVAPDLALARLPWAALPGEKPGTILLEDHAVAVLPHAAFLLDKLWPPDPVRSQPTDALVVGGVAYDAATPMGQVATLRGELPVKPGQKLGWEALPGAAAEAHGVVAAAGRARVSALKLSGQQATPTAVIAALPGARFAHLATHGFFADPSFRSAFQVDAKLFEVSRGGERVGAAALSPLVMTGLVFAGANRPETPGRGVVTGEALVDLNLSGLDLAVLSACEAGLGDAAGGEGTFGLQRAFHLAGTRDVIASLWKVPDRPTAALMAEFYRNLWEAKLPPVEALRQAQLAIYRNPSKVPELAAKFRGEFKEVAGKGENLPAGTDGKAHPLQWAAFTLSGPGR